MSGIEQCLVISFLQREDDDMLLILLKTMKYLECEENRLQEEEDLLTKDWTDRLLLLLKNKERDPKSKELQVVLDQDDSLLNSVHHCCHDGWDAVGGERSDEDDGKDDDRDDDDGEETMMKGKMSVHPKKQDPDGKEDGGVPVESIARHVSQCHGQERE